MPRRAVHRAHPGDVAGLFNPEAHGADRSSVRGFPFEYEVVAAMNNNRNANNLNNVNNNNVDNANNLNNANNANNLNS